MNARRIKKLTTLALIVLGAPLWWWSYWRLDSKEVHRHQGLFSKSTGVRPPPNSFNALLEKAKESGNRRLFNLLTGFAPITVHRPGSEFTVKVPGDLDTSLVQQDVASTDDTHGVLAAKSYANPALQRVLNSWPEIDLQDRFQETIAIYVPGDIDSRFDWNAAGDQRVRVRLGTFVKHVILPQNLLPELLRRKKLLLDAGVLEAPEPTREEIEADAREEEQAYPVRLTLEQTAPYFLLPPDLAQNRTLFKRGELSAGSTVLVYATNSVGHTCHVTDESGSVAGWIDAPREPTDCGLPPPPPERQREKLVALPRNWVNAEDNRELERRAQQIEDATINPVEPVLASTLQFSEIYAVPFTIVFVAWCVFAIVRSQLQNARLERYSQLLPTRPWFDVADFGVPHSRFERLGPGSFRVTLRNNNYSGAAAVISFFAVPTLAILYFFFGGLSTWFPVILTITAAAWLFSMYREPSSIEVHPDTIVINGALMERDHFGSFHVHGRRQIQLGYEYGMRNYWLPGGWPTLEVTEIASALNTYISIRPVISTQPDPPKPGPIPIDIDLRKKRPDKY
jgi:hypothetical protein